jgi:negative elongation factor C/D
LLRALFDEAFRWDPTGSAPERVSVSGARASAEARGARSACLDLIALAVSVDARDRSSTRGDLDAALATLEAASRGEVPEEASFRALLARCPAAASGVAAWVGSAMGNPEHYKRVSATANTVAYLRALSEACRAGGAGVRERALEVITDALRAMGRGSSEALHLATLDAAVELVEAGLVLPTLDAATEAWAGEIDPSHLRYFAGEVLEVAGPPYGGKFAAAALRLLRSANARRGMTRATDEFVDQCRRQRARGALAPPLGKELDDVLDRLAGNR